MITSSDQWYWFKLRSLHCVEREHQRFGYQIGKNNSKHQNNSFASNDKLCHFSFRQLQLLFRLPRQEFKFSSMPRPKRQWIEPPSELSYAFTSLRTPTIWTEPPPEVPFLQLGYCRQNRNLPTLETSTAFSLNYMYNINRRIFREPAFSPDAIE